MKSKNIPADIKVKSIKDAQIEIKEIIEKLENVDTNLENSKALYERMMKLNLHIQDKFRQKNHEINNTTSKKISKDY